MKNGDLKVFLTLIKNTGYTSVLEAELKKETQILIVFIFLRWQHIAVKINLTINQLKVLYIYGDYLLGFGLKLDANIT